MRVVVVGLGSAGRRHAETLRSLGHDVRACRREPGDDDFGSLDDALAWGPDAVVIATPTAAHVDALRWAVEHGIAAYVEKPLAARSAGLRDLLARAESERVTVAVGYNLRFHPAVEAVEQAVREGLVGSLLTAEASAGSYLPDWHPDEDYRLSYASRRELGGGVLLTLSHELDLVRALAGEIVEVVGLALRASALELDVDDAAGVVARHDSGALSTVRVDYLDRAYNRRSRWVGELGTIAWEWRGDVRLEPGGKVLWSDPGFDVSATYRAALDDFLDAVQHDRRPRVDGRDGLRIVEICEQVGEART